MHVIRVCRDSSSSSTERERGYFFIGMCVRARDPASANRLLFFSLASLYLYIHRDDVHARTHLLTAHFAERQRRGTCVGLVVVVVVGLHFRWCTRGNRRARKEIIINAHASFSDGLRDLILYSSFLPGLFFHAHWLSREEFSADGSLIPGEEPLPGRIRRLKRSCGR